MTTRLCRGVGCGRTIGFIRTVNGQAMPVDPEPVTCTLGPAGTGPRVTLITGGGETKTGQHDPDAEPVTGYLPHWATCPARAAFTATR